MFIFLGIIILVGGTMTAVVIGQITTIFTLKKRVRSLESSVKKIYLLLEKSAEEEQMQNEAFVLGQLGYDPIPMPEGKDEIPEEYEEAIEPEPQKELQEPAFAQVPDMEPIQQPKFNTPEGKPAFSPASQYKEVFNMEELLGIKGALIAGIITALLGFGFFLKYAYDRAWLGPLARDIVAAACGVAALVVGEITRRKDFDIVAKGVTALGFGILYGVVFTAYRLHGLIESPTITFILAIMITISAMAYALILNEPLMAIISLLGGFLSPILISTGQNAPISLFTYVAILSLGSMMCAWYKKWNNLNLLSFVGTIILYFLWFFKFYGPEITGSEFPAQMPIAVMGATVFFAMYLAIPFLYGIVNREPASYGSITIVLANSIFFMAALAMIFYPAHSKLLAVIFFGLAAIYIGMIAGLRMRVPEDESTSVVLFVIGTFFATLALPLMFDMYVLAIAWAIEAVVLSVISIRYNKIVPKVASLILMGLSIFQLITTSPLHDGSFRLLATPEFWSWVGVAAIAYIIHLIYRKADDQRVEATTFFIASMALLLAAIVQECYYHCDYNFEYISFNEQVFHKSLLVIASAFSIAVILPKFSPRGAITYYISTIMGLFAVFGSLVLLPEIREESGLMFINKGFMYPIITLGASLISMLLTLQLDENLNYRHTCKRIMASVILIGLWLIVSEEIYLFFQFSDYTNWKFIAQLGISIWWAVYAIIHIVSGVTFKVSTLRYFALGVFGLLLLKVFIVDTSTVKSIYRIAAFIITGITLVGVSYLYQMLKKRGFFNIE